MPRPTIKFIADMSNRDTKRQLQAAIGALSEMYEVDIKPHRNTRSLRQNAWYWACIVTPFYDFLRAQDYDINDPEDAHELIKDKFLRRKLRKRNGEAKGSMPGSTTKLDTAEFSEFAERVRAWLLDQFGIETMSPDEGIEAVKHG